MKTPIRVALCTLAVAASLQVTFAADDVNPPAAKRTGHVLIRENESTIEGDIELIGGQYRVRRPVGELIVQPENVLKLCESREDAYLFLRHRANLRDPD